MKYTTDYQVVQKLINWKRLIWSGSYYVFIIKRKRWWDEWWEYYIDGYEDYETFCWERTPDFDDLKKFKTEQSAMEYLNHHILKKPDDMDDEYVCHTVRQ
jgi:hypothetical protein